MNMLILITGYCTMAGESTAFPLKNGEIFLFFLNNFYNGLHFFWNWHIMQMSLSISQWNTFSVSSKVSLSVLLSQPQPPSRSIFFPSYKNWLAEMGVSPNLRNRERSDLRDHQPQSLSCDERKNPNIRIVNRVAQMHSYFGAELDRVET